MNLLGKETVDYVSRYGGNCRDCADHRGVCPVSSLPCENRLMAIRWVIDAINYGFAHGFLKVNKVSPVTRPHHLPTTET
jgi:hypothetical protein